MTDNKPFDVVGPGHVAEHHNEEQYRHRLDPEYTTKAAGPGFAWLAFYLIAFVAVVVGHFEGAGTAVVATVNQVILMATGGTLL